MEGGKFEATLRELNRFLLFFVFGVAVQLLAVLQDFVGCYWMINSVKKYYTAWKICYGRL